jgi:diguanylate cyclase (GGDEF)-like protein
MIGQVSVSLWQLVNNFWQEVLDKYNFRSALKIHTLNQQQQHLFKKVTQNAKEISLDFPHGLVPIDSCFYVNRPPIESIVCSEITKAGGFIGIKAAPKMGKSSLILRIIERANSLGYQSVSLDFLEADRTVFTSIDSFLRWFCANISQKLGLETRLNSYWLEEIGSKASCSNYFQHYLLASLKKPLVLILNELDFVLNYPEIAEDFILLLNSWYEQSKYSDIWQNFRLVLEYSQDFVGGMQLNKSLFDIGLTVKLPPFTKEQVEDLAKRYDLNWSDEDNVQYLLDMVGGHPQLIRLALFYLFFKEDKQCLRQLLDQAFSEGGIYEEYLRQYLLLLWQQPELKTALYQTVRYDHPVKLELKIAYKLHSLGLVNLECDRVYPKCELFRLYFRKHLCKDFEERRIEALELENQELRELSTLDELTKLVNRRYFEKYLQVEWLRYTQEKADSYPHEGITLSLILCDIDYFKLYNKTYGNNAGDDCLRKIADTINKAIKDLADSSPTLQDYLVGRLGGEEFVVILPLDAAIAVSIADDIREKIKTLAIPCDYPGIGGLPAEVLTVSIGVASAVPDAETGPEVLLNLAENALNLAKRHGHDRVVLG